MIKKWKIILVSALIIIAFACAIVAGCSFNLTLDDVLKDYNLGPSVTYFLNSGSFEDDSQQKTMYYSVGSKPFNIGVDKLVSGSADVNDLHGYEFTGWYGAVLGENGLPLYVDGTEYDGNKLDTTKGGIQFGSEPFDFSKELQEGDHYYVCATWGELIKLRILLVCEGFETLTSSNGTEYKTGDEIRQYVLNADMVDPGGNRLVSVKRGSYTFVEYYEDLECTKPFTDWPIKAKTEGEDEVLYAKFLEGDWKIVKTASDVQSMFGDTGKSYYFTNDIDCSSLNAVIKMNNFGGKIIGNGYTVSNLKVSSGGYLRNGKASVFGDIFKEAEINDIKFENLSANFNIMTGGNVETRFVFSSVEEGAKITDMEIGGKLTVNLSDGSEVSMFESNWLFGGYSNGSYTGGITVTDGSICELVGADGASQTFEYKKTSEVNL